MTKLSTGRDSQPVAPFGLEWASLDQPKLSDAECAENFAGCFGIFCGPHWVAVGRKI